MKNKMQKFLVYGCLSLLIAGVAGLAGCSKPAATVDAMQKVSDQVANELDKETKASQSKTCVNHLRAIGMAFMQWRLDHGDAYPFNVSTSDGGTRELCARGSDGFDASAPQVFQVMSNELNGTGYLVCPLDTARTAAADFQHFTAANLSYQLRTGTNITGEAAGEILAQCPIHGHILHADGSVTAGAK